MSEEHIAVGAQASVMATEIRQSSVEAITQIRSRADITAKAMGTVATTLITVIGLTKVIEIFPLPDRFTAGDYVAAAFIGIGLTLALASIVYVTRAIWVVQEPISITATADNATAFPSEVERKLVTAAFTETAHANRATRLRAYELRAERFERIAERAEPRLAVILNERADVIQREVRAALAKAAADVLRARSKNAMVGSPTLAAIIAFVVGLVLFAGGGGYLNPHPSVELAEKCANAEKASGTDLPRACDK